jgi:hypothetical protein
MNVVFHATGEKRRTIQPFGDLTEVGMQGRPTFGSRKSGRRSLVEKTR